MGDLNTYHEPSADWHDPRNPSMETVKRLATDVKNAMDRLVTTLNLAATNGIKCEIDLSSMKHQAIGDAYAGEYWTGTVRSYASIN